MWVAIGCIALVPFVLLFVRIVISLLRDAPARLLGAFAFALITTGGVLALKYGISGTLQR